ncbi:hypothetical protein NNO_1399 [Hydrogenimonas sp.]|nr:hypothetical protein NNO_1399 [Hydrogenimonas sp.]
MKRRFLVSLLTITALPALLCADYTRGVYGKLEYVLMHDNVSDKYNSTDRKSFVQNYQIGYESYIYSPRLLTYDLGFSFYVDNTTSDVNNNGSSTKSENETKHTNYKAYLHFLKKADYPFTVYYEKIDSPLWSTSPGGTTLVTYKTDKSGIYGRVKTDLFNLSYEYRESKTEKTESFAYENGDSKRFALGINKQLDENRTASFNYSHEIRNYYRTDLGLNYTDSWNDVIDSAVATYSWLISKRLAFSSAVNYLKNDYLDYQNLTGTVSLNWTPSKKHSETFSIVADNTKTKEGTNTFVSLNESGNYKFSKSFSTNHGFQIYNASGNLYNMTLASATLGSNYLKEFSETLSTSFGLSVTGRAEKYDYSDQNVTIRDRNMFSYTLSTSTTKQFPEGRSNLSAGLSYYQLISTTDDATQRITANTIYNKKFTDQLSYYLKMYGTFDKNTYTAADNNETTRTTNIFSVDNALNYWRAVGYNGKMTLKAGVVYSVGTYANRTNPYGTFTFFYMLRRDLMFKTLARVSSDTAYNVTSYTGSTDLIYRIRKIEMRTGIQMSRQTGGGFGERNHINYYFRISRKL